MLVLLLIHALDMNLMVSLMRCWLMVGKSVNYCGAYFQVDVHCSTVNLVLD